MVKLAAWNVNSLRVRLPHVLDWLAESQADALGLQETKLIDAKFPKAEIEEAGYHVVFAGQPTYNGVAILARRDRFAVPADLVINNPLFPDEQVRLIGATLTPLTASGQAFRFISAYVPNGAAVGTDKYDYKLRWLTALQSYLKDQLIQTPRLAIVGDYNIAPEDRDVHDPAAWVGSVHVSPEERAALRRLTDGGLVDLFRRFEQPEAAYSWWDYRAGAFRRNHGLRIDLIFARAALAARCSACRIDREPRRAERPSDHTPVIAEFTR